MLEGSAALALGAGMLAALNPCGFALLPAYLTLLISADQPSRLTAVSRALKMTAAMTAGFTSVFAVFGLVIAPVASSAQRYLPWFTVVVGVALAVAGIWLLAGRSLTLTGLKGGGKTATAGGAPITRSVTSMFGFGVSYAIASLTCTVAPFLAVVVSAFRADSLASGALLFLLYAAGMGLVVGTAALAVALAQQSLVRGARRLGRAVPVLGGALLLLVGVYVAYYGWWEIRVLAGGSAQDPVIDAALDLQQWLVSGVDSVGPGGFVLVAAGLASSAARPVWSTDVALATMSLPPHSPQRARSTMNDRPDSVDVIVIGMGVAGEAVAGSLASEGLSVIGVESQLVGGECPYWGCIPSKMMIRAAHTLAETRRVEGLAGTATATPSWAPVAQRIREEATDDWNDKVAVDRFVEQGGHFVRGRARIVGPGRVDVDGRVIEARRGVVLATGTVPSVPPVPGLDQTPFWTNREAVATTTLPESLIVLGGGAIGLELAQVFARFGVAVTVVEVADRLLAAEEPEASSVVHDALVEDGLSVHVGARGRAGQP